MNRNSERVGPNGNTQRRMLGDAKLAGNMVQAWAYHHGTVGRPEAATRRPRPLSLNFPFVIREILPRALGGNALCRGEKAPCPRKVHRGKD